MIYIVLKSLCHNVEQSFMAFNNLFQDMNNKGNLRPYAMRALLETVDVLFLVFLVPTNNNSLFFCRPACMRSWIVI